MTWRGLRRLNLHFFKYIFNGSLNDLRIGVFLPLNAMLNFLLWLFISRPLIIFIIWLRCRYYHYFPVIFIEICMGTMMIWWCVNSSICMCYGKTYWTLECIRWMSIHGRIIFIFQKQVRLFGRGSWNCRRHRLIHTLIIDLSWGSLLIIMKFSAACADKRTRCLLQILIDFPVKFSLFGFLICGIIILLLKFLFAKVSYLNKSIRVLAWWNERACELRGDCSRGFLQDNRTF